MTEQTDIIPPLEIVPPLGIVAAKKALRAHAIILRRDAMAAGGGTAAAALAAQVERLGIAAGSVVGGYWPMGDEIDCRPLMDRLAGLGCRLALPVVAARGQPLTFRAWRYGDVLEPGLHGTFHPVATAAELAPDVLLVPLLAFDSQCFRLGYGGGYYDRTLESLKAGAHVKSIGLAFAAQQVAAMPRDGYDQRLDMVATEGGLIMPENP
jgi:5-formyltetrahydrofolate cyclo-ligase